MNDINIALEKFNVSQVLLANLKADYILGKASVEEVKREEYKSNKNFRIFNELCDNYGIYDYEEREENYRFIMKGIVLKVPYIRILMKVEL